MARRRFPPNGETLPVVVLVRRVDSDELCTDELRRLRRLMDRAFGGRFSDDDWDHALGGIHVLFEDGDEVLSHASVVPRTLRVGHRSFSAGYVEAVATDPLVERRGYATLVMAEVARGIAEGFDLGALSTASPGFYTRLGWERWVGPTAVATDAGIALTPEDDGGVMVLRTPAAGAVDLTAIIACEWRQGDVW